MNSRFSRVHLTNRGIPSETSIFASKPGWAFAFSVLPNRFPDRSQSRAGNNSGGVGFPVDSLIAAANSAMVVSFPEARLYVSEGVPPKAHLINPFAISSTKIKSRLERPSFSRGKASWSRDFHTNVGVTFLHTVCGVPRQRPAPRISRGP